MAKPMHATLEQLTGVDIPPLVELWLPVALFLLLIPVAQLVLAVLRRVWLAGVAKAPLDRVRARQRVDTLISFIRSVVYFALVLLAMMHALQAMFPGFNAGTATGALSIVALVLTGMFRDLVVDVVKGLDILFGGHYGVGDYIRVGNYSGYVIDFQLKYTKLRSAAGEEVIVNNAACIPSRRFPEGWVANYVDIVLENPGDEAKAKGVLNELGKSLTELVEPIKAEPEFRAAFAQPATGALTLRYVVRVLPGADWALSDRYLPMIRTALEKAAIPLARDVQYFFMNDLQEFRELFDRQAPTPVESHPRRRRR
jgi:small conductance mechanosensitive channel